MGVRGLSSFVNDFFSCWVKYEPKGGMVIDGYSFLYTFFLGSNIDWIHGGQYWLLRDRLLEFFESLKMSGIQAIVIMDGVELEKTELTLKKVTERIQTMYRALTEQQHQNFTRGRLLPLLAKKVFVKVLNEIGVPFYIADGEADPITVAFANHYHYPIVANDSDYYMFNVDYGYIPLDRLRWKTQPVTAEVYMLTTFNQVFEINNLQLSRAIPAILGNDYIESQRDLFTKEGIISTERNYEVASLVRYVSKVQSVDQLLSHIERTLDDGQAIAKTMLRNIEKAEKLYNVAETISREDIMNNSVLVPTSNKKIPWWIIQQYRQGQFHPQLMRALICEQCFFHAIAEDPLRPASCRASRGIRQSIYSLLSPLLKEKMITEMIRTAAKPTWPVAVLASEEVRFSPVTVALPSLYNMNEVSFTKKVSVVCEVIGVRCEILDLFDKEWKLVVLAACYWVKECCPSQILIKSLVMCFLHCSNLKNTADREILSFLPNMRRTAVWMEALHIFACFQCIYTDMVKLNNVLQNPLVTVSPAFFFDGKFVQMYTCTDEFEKIINKEFVPSPLYEKLMRTLTSFN